MDSRGGRGGVGIYFIVIRWMNTNKSACIGEEFSQLKESLGRRYSQYQVQDHQMIYQQCELIEDIKQKLERKRTYESYHNSFSSNSFSSLPVFTSSDESFRNRFSEEFESSIIDAAMREVKANCAEDTYQTILGYLSGSKSKDHDDLKRQIQKKNKEIEELSALIIIKQKDVCFLQREMFGLRQREADLEDEKKKIKKRVELLDQKQKRLHNVQMSLIFKEKLSLQVKRRYQRQRDLNQATEQQLQRVYNQLQSIWAKIFQRTNDSTWVCSGNCWKQQIMRRCKEQLVQQRRILKEQSKQIQQQYDTMRNLSDQIKKVLILPPQSPKRADDLPIQK